MSEKGEEDCIRKAQNCLSKASSCQRYYDQQSDFLESAKWIVIINKIKTLFSNDTSMSSSQTTSVSTTSATSIITDISSISVTSSATTNTQTILTTSSITDISAVTKFLHGNRHKEGVTRYTMLQTKGNKNAANHNIIPYKQYKTYLDGGHGKGNKISLDGHGFL